MKYMVTGGAGFIGSHLCEALVGQGHKIACVDNFNDYYSPKIKWDNLAPLRNHPGYSLHETDILNFDQLERIFGEHDFDGIIHLAARAGVRPSIQNPQLYQRVNVEGTVNLFNLCVKHGVRKFILASTSSVYGNNKKVPFHEDDNVDFPISPYAATKKACELLAHTYHHLHGIAMTCLRFFTVYGPRQRPDMAIHKFTELIHSGREIPVFGDGSTRRDYTYVDDIVQGVVRAVERCEGYRIYNLGESQTITLKNLIGLIETGLNRKAKILQMPMQPGDVNITYADISRAKKALDYRPVTPIEAGIPKFIAWYLNKTEAAA